MLTALAIALATVTYATAASLPYMIAHVISTPDSARRVVTTNQSGFLYSLPAADKRIIEKIPHVVAVSAITFFGGVYRSPSDQLGIGVDAEATDRIWPDWGITHPMAERFAAERTACLVPAPMLRKYGWQVGQTIIIKGTTYPIDLTLHIIDRLDSAPADSLLFRRDYLDEASHAGGRVNAFYVMTDAEQNLPALIGAIDETFANSGAITRSASEADWVSSLINLKTLLLALDGVAMVAIVAIWLVAANSMMMEIRERKRELALMQALGFQPSTVAALVVSESTAIGLAGGILGCTIVLVFAKLVPASLIALGPVDLFDIVSVPVLLRGIAAGAIIGAIAGAICLPGLLRRTPTEALRAIV